MVADGSIGKAQEVTAESAHVTREASDFHTAVHWCLYARRREREVAATINLANRIFNIPRDQWAKR